MGVLRKEKLALCQEYQPHTNSEKLHYYLKHGFC